MIRSNRWLTLSCLVLAACGSGRNKSEARLDLSSLVEHAAQSGVRISRLELRIHAADFDPLVLAVPVESLEFTLDVPSGPGRTFEIEAYEADATRGEVTTYWGESVFDLPANAKVDVVIPAFRAGRARGTVVVFGGLLPSDVQVRFLAQAPPADAPWELYAPVLGDTYERPLPIGPYTVELGFDTFSLVRPVSFEVLQGELADTALVLAPPNYCDASLGQLPDADGDGTPCDRDCDDGDPSRERNDADKDGLTTCDGDCDDTNATCLVDCTDGDADGTCSLRDCDDDPSTGGNCFTGCVPVYPDADEDGFGDASAAAMAVCAPSNVQSLNNADCNDSAPLCNVDNACTDADGDGACVFHDCDDGGTFAGGCTSGCATWFADADGDGEGDSAVQYTGCQPSGYAASSNDCDDSPVTGPGCVVGCAPLHADGDDDGFGALAVSYTGCPGAGFVTNGADCDDTKNQCNTDFDCIDGDGDGACTNHDCDDTGVHANLCTAGCATWFADADGDGGGDSLAQYTGCQPSGFVSNVADCDDDATTGGGCTIGCAPMHLDSDDDTFGDAPIAYNGCQLPGYSTNGADCDDSKPLCNVDAGCADGDSDGACIAHDCDDDGLGHGPLCTTGCATWFADADGDGSGESETQYTGCQPPGFANNSTDCDDDPGTGASCTVGCAPQHTDADGDGFGTAPVVYSGCPNVGFATNGVDCDDTKAECNTDSVCTDLDNDGACSSHDCDEDPTTGDACKTGCSTFFLDFDQDGHGTSGTSITRCAPPSRWAALADDCNDRDPDVWTSCGSCVDTDGDGRFTGCNQFVRRKGGDCNPSNAAIATGLPEKCNDGLDNDCDTFVDGADGDCACPDNDADGYRCGDCDDSGATGALHTLADNDKDGETTCSVPVDCNDSSFAQNGRQLERCNPGNPNDEDCDGVANGADPDCACADVDGDGYCPPLDCDDMAGALTPVDADGDGWSRCENDCDDNWPFTNPGASEHCFDNADNDCNGQVDQADSACLGADTDNDGFVVADCDPVNSALNAADKDLDRYSTCDFPADCAGDTNASIVPIDLDGDGFSACDGDCDDANFRAHPGALEVCDKIDNDCNATTDEGCAQSDADGIPDALDNCPLVSNPTQQDIDRDGVGDACEAGCENDALRSTAFVENCFDSANRDEDCDGLASGQGANSDPGCTGRGTCSAGDDPDSDEWYTASAGCTPPVSDTDEGSPLAHPNIRRESGVACSDAFDNDNDGASDGLDGDCAGVVCDAPLVLSPMRVVSDRTNAYVQADNCRLAGGEPQVGSCVATAQTLWTAVHLINDLDSDASLFICNRGDMTTEALVTQSSSCGPFTCVGSIAPFQCVSVPVVGSGEQTYFVSLRASSEACTPFKKLAWELQLRE